MRKTITSLLGLVLSVALLTACGGRQQKEPTIEGLYTYGHVFDYDLQGNHLDVTETGTMEFRADGTGLDSAQQVYTATMKDGGMATYVFNYVSPSRWSSEGDTLHFAGVKETFRMEALSTTLDGCDSVYAAALAETIIKVIGGSIDYEYRFHIDTLTADELRWSFTYRDGHSDTWQFHRVAEQ